MNSPTKKVLPNFNEAPVQENIISKKQPSKFYLVLDKGFLKPLNTYVVYPIKKVVKEFSVNKYVLMFIVAAILYAIIVISGYPVWNFFD